MQRSIRGGAEHARPVMVCFSHLRWGFVFQRPQHLLARAARSWRVLFIEEPVADDRASTPRLVHRDTEEGVEVVVPMLSPSDLADADLRADRLRRLLDDLLASGGEASGGEVPGAGARLAATPAIEPDLLWYYTPMALAFSGHLRAPVTVYDCMDELSQFKDAPADLVSLERDLMRRADVVFTGGQSLYRAKRGLHANVHAFPSSVDVAHFAPARSARDGAGVAPEIAALPRPRIGWFGVIDERLDLALVEGVARARPGWQLVMIGPVVKIDAATLPRHDNVHWLGVRRYEALPAHLAGLDVGWMPFAINDATRFISPTKTPEFLAAGLPVVSTPVRDVVDDWGRDGSVAIADDVAGSVAAIEAVIRRGRNTGWLARVDARLAALSWDRTWAAMAEVIAAAGARVPEQPAVATADGDG